MLTSLLPVTGQDPVLLSTVLIVGVCLVVFTPPTGNASTGNASTAESSKRDDK